MGAQVEARPDPVDTSPPGFSPTPQQPAGVEALTQQVQGPAAQRGSVLLLSPGSTGTHHRWVHQQLRQLQACWEGQR